ncbi:heat-inducible transcriptional repressor HrcA [Chlamydia gallinacea]|uniref:Heat-inducible transcription repressor HrcA n=2 Tax=Chlamydia gallinacea TaxID=1457153 RepID=A0A173DZE6_9CHLA|nr:heat-inducible transcriptional repressor HrcA [Chlamydia gallinacea]EYE61849.1 heat-inducible transcription repressor HrcA [Bacteroides fragilis str. S6L5]ANG66304.1 heat-inducible transcriptional repressor HrcA [Chlamydia gallinacea 08-1274/3]AQT77489.1 heat-inducible transcriptional repressor HrcA [Chlamydia gallinacea]MBX6679861.1 heat-inducible transcriptional repressor HrcA [Chlamydia gallinacea]MBX6687093.1 heat-inducible transcriptional repressor HrcA [Chlamydia gallinacea]
MSRSRVSKRDSKILYILLTTTELYLKTGQPVGSKTLKEHECSNLSTATIRNYFSELEAEGFLKKNHVSGGRIPTDLAFRYYVDHCATCCSEELPEATTQLLNQLPDESRNIVKDLQKASEILGEALQLPICFSSPRFENDTVTNIQLTQIDEQRLVVILSTEFGQVFTDTLWLPEVVPPASLKRIEIFLQTHIRKLPFPKESISQKEEDLGMILYNEIVIRYLTRHCNFSEEDLYQTGLSKLLQYESFKDPDMLALGLSFFENRRHMSKLLDIGMHRDRPTAFIGSELSDIFGTPNPQCTVITTPYYMNRTPLGAFGVLGPMNLPYKEIYATLTMFADKIKASLTQSFYKFKLSFRRPCPSDPKLSNDPILLARYSSIKLLPPKETP